LLSLDQVFLLRKVEVPETEENDDKGEKKDGDHNDDPRCGAIIGSLDLDDSWVKLFFLHDLLNCDVLVDSLLFKNGLDIWSEDRFSSRNSIDVFNVFDHSVRLSCGDDDWVVALCRYGTI
jgi:hypothetical protein